MSDPTRLNVPLIAYMENKPCDVCDHVSDSLFTCMHYFTYQKWTKHWEPTPATIRRNQCLDLCFWLILGWYWLTRDGRWSFALCHDASTHKGKRKRAHNTFFFCWIPFCYSAVEAGHEISSVLCQIPIWKRIFIASIVHYSGHTLGIVIVIAMTHLHCHFYMYASHSSNQCVTNNLSSCARNDVFWRPSHHLCSKQLCVKMTIASWLASYSIKRNKTTHDCKKSIMYMIMLRTKVILDCHAVLLKVDHVALC